MGSIRQSIRGGGTGSAASSPFRSVTSQATSSPTTPAFTLRGTDTAVKIYLYDTVDITADEGCMVNVTVTDGTNSRTVAAIWGQAYILRGFNAGSSLAIGITNFAGTGLARTITCVSVPTISSFPTAVVECNVLPDQGYPVEWTTHNVVATLPADNSEISFSGVSRQAVVWMKEIDDDGNASPPQAVIVQPGRQHARHCRYRRIALCWPELSGLTLTAPVGTSFGDLFYDKLSWSGEFTATRTVPCADAAAVNDAIADLEDGDDIVLTFVNDSGTPETPSAITITGNKSVRIRSESQDRTTCVLKCDLSVDLNSSANRFHLEGVTWQTDGTTTDPWKLATGTHRVENCDITRSAGSARHVCVLNLENGNGTMKFFNCNVTGATANSLDVINTGNSGSSSAGTGRIDFIGCSASGAGGGASDQVWTPHDHINTYCWGGHLFGPGASDPLTGAAANTSRSYFIGTWMNDGSGGTIDIEGSFINSVAFGCHMDDVDTCQIRQMIGTYMGCSGTKSGGYWVTSGDFTWFWIGSRAVLTGSSGRAADLLSTKYVIIGAEATGFANGMGSFDNASSAAPQIMWNCRMPGPNFVQRSARAGLSEFLFNIWTSGVTTDSSAGDLKNILCDGNICSSTISDNMEDDDTGERNTVTPLANTESTAATLGSESIPTEAGNCEFLGASGFASGLSSGNQSTLRNRLTAQLGWMGANGDALYLSTTIVSRGPRQRQYIDSGFGLHPAARTTA